MNNYLDNDSLYYFNQGVSTAAYESLGCHPSVGQFGEKVYRFAVWAPNAKSVSVVGDFNGWNPDADRMERMGNSGVWIAYLGFAQAGQLYKFQITTQKDEILMKSDPFAFRSEDNGTASVIYEIPEFKWTDKKYLTQREDPYHKPMNIYEVHAGTWKDNLNYRSLADDLIPYVKDMGYTHIELLPLTEYPFEKSWGYQVTGYFCPTHRYGSPEDLMYFVNKAHKNNISVILDWVPAHFVKDSHGLKAFDGTCCYEHSDPKRGENPQWGTCLFNFERPEVQSFLISSAIFWLKEYHFDGLRLDAVSCMLYLDYGKEKGQWIPNVHGGHENLAAIDFLKKLSTHVRQLETFKMLIAEESTAFPCVTADPEHGLGFTFKWNMGWMNDMLTYMEMDSYFRKGNHDKLTFSMYYAFSENFILPFSHDEVVHGKKSMLNKMPGDYWQQFAQLRLIYSYQYAHPGKKLMFMGSEFGQYIEWKDDQGLDWKLLTYPKHVEMQRFVRDLNHFYTSNQPMYQIDDCWDGFEWLIVDDTQHSVASWCRKDRDGNMIVCVFNFTPVEHNDYRIGVPMKGLYYEALSSDMQCYGGTGDYINGTVKTDEIAHGNFKQSINIKVPPYAGVYFTFKGDKK